MLQVDVIVNSANRALSGGGGVDGTIHRVGGEKILAECREIRDRHYPDGLPVGKAVFTGGGNLRCNYVVHTVGPVWSGGGNGEQELLTNAYRNSLILARDIGARTIAFPSISTGIFCYPREKAAVVAYKTIESFLCSESKIEKIICVFYHLEDYQIFIDTVDDYLAGALCR